MTISDVCGTEVTFDVLLRSPPPCSVVAAECKGWNKPVDQGRLFEFAKKVEGLRKTLGLPISPFFLVKRGAQEGAVKVANWEDVVVIEWNGGDMTDDLTFRYLLYDPERERRITEGIASLRENVQIQESVVLHLESADGG